jgi:hypothetical protein
MRKSIAAYWGSYGKQQQLGMPESCQPLNVIECGRHFMPCVPVMILLWNVSFFFILLFYRMLPAGFSINLL